MHKLIRYSQHFAMLIAVPVLASGPLWQLRDGSQRRNLDQKQAAMHQQGLEGHSGMAAAGTCSTSYRRGQRVAAMAHLKDVRAAMAKMGMKTPIT